MVWGSYQLSAFSAARMCDARPKVRRMQPGQRRFAAACVPPAKLSNLLRVLAQLVMRGKRVQERIRARTKAELLSGHFVF